MKHLKLEDVIKWVEDPVLSMDEVSKLCNVKSRSAVYDYLARHDYEVIGLRKVIRRKKAKS